MNYNESLEYIHSISNFFCKPGLERISELCEKMGNPQDKLKFIHVAGTNGKGSFCSMLASVLKCAGYKTGLYTSPYILKFNERIAVDGEMISDSDLADITAYVKSFADGMADKPTEFELITAIAFEYFKRAGCDIVVLECGLGGKLDATNVITSPVLSVITGISIDHTAFLGNTIKEIASEKAGIIKKDIPSLWCGDNESAYKVIKSVCIAQNSVLHTVDHKLLSITRCDLKGTVFSFDAFMDISIPLLGSYQPINAANVLTAVTILKESGYVISEENIRMGLMDTVWHARFELLSEDPIVIADGAHNPEGIEKAIESIKMYFDDTKVNIVTGVMKDKDYKYIAETLSHVARCVYCVTPDNPRALSSEEYKDVFLDMGVSAVASDSVYEAMLLATKNSRESCIPTVALGSLYMYSEVADFVERYNNNS